MDKKTALNQQYDVYRQCLKLSKEDAGSLLQSKGQGAANSKGMGSRGCLLLTGALLLPEFFSTFIWKLWFLVHSGWYFMWFMCAAAVNKRPGIEQANSSAGSHPVQPVPTLSPDK